MLWFTLQTSDTVNVLFMARPTMKISPQIGLWLAARNMATEDPSFLP